MTGRNTPSFDEVVSVPCRIQVQELRVSEHDISKPPPSTLYTIAVNGYGAGDPMPQKEATRAAIDYAHPELDSGGGSGGCPGEASVLIVSPNVGDHAVVASVVGLAWHGGSLSASAGGEVSGSVAGRQLLPGSMTKTGLVMT
mmetsp:Transcript_17693/g.26719  ORF Transcript_17693/g.26719 Transcript_17693/m.26719 type:complete len:142 (-) Transcript_17693:132-557(-)